MTRTIPYLRNLIERGREQAPDQLAQTPAAGKAMRDKISQIEVARKDPLPGNDQEEHSGATRNYRARWFRRVVDGPVPGLQQRCPSPLLHETGSLRLENGFYKSAILPLGEGRRMKNTMWDGGGKPAQDQVRNAGVTDAGVEHLFTLEFQLMSAAEGADVGEPELAPIGSRDAFRGDALQRRVHSAQCNLAARLHWNPRCILSNGTQNCPPV
jgi:hypothetical protein